VLISLAGGLLEEPMSIGSAWAADAAEVQKTATIDPAGGKGSRRFGFVGEPLWECVKSALLAMRGSSLVIFDWDDTLFPTTALEAGGNLKSRAQMLFTRSSAKAEAKPDNKHAAKRQSKKDGASDKASAEENVAAAKKALKAMDSQSLSNATFEVCSAAMAAHMVMHTRLGQAVVLAHGLVQAAMEKTEKFVEFTGHEDLSAWTTLFLKFVFYNIFIGCALIAAPLAMALDISIFGAQLLVQSGAKAVQGFGKLEDAEAFLASKQGLIAMAGTVAFGTLWQFWSLMADSGMAWYFQLAYLPAVIAESIVGCF